MPKIPTDDPKIKYVHKCIDSACDKLFAHINAAVPTELVLTPDEAEHFSFYVYSMMLTLGEIQPNE